MKFQLHYGENYIPEQPKKNCNIKNCLIFLSHDSTCTIRIAKIDNPQKYLTVDFVYHPLPCQEIAHTQSGRTHLYLIILTFFDKNRIQEFGLIGYDHCHLLHVRFCVF